MLIFAKEISFFKHRAIIVFCFFSILLSNSNDEQRIVTIGGSVTEIAFALGVGESIIAVDQSSTIPEKVLDLPQVGYIRAISSEGILSVMPTKIITTSDMGPPNVIKQIQDSGVELVILDAATDFDGILRMVGEIANSLDVPEEGERVYNKILKEFSKVKTLVSKNAKKSKVAFFMDMTGSKVFNAAGKGTRGDYLIEVIGGKNIFKNDFKRYSKVSSESLIKYNPDLILIATKGFSGSLKSYIYDEKSLESISAVSSKNVFEIDIGYYLTFGTNFSDAVLKLLEEIK